MTTQEGWSKDGLYTSLSCLDGKRNVARMRGRDPPFSLTLIPPSSLSLYHRDLMPTYASSRATATRNAIRIVSTAAQSASNAAVLASFVSLGVTQIMLMFVEQVSLLLAFTALGAGLMVGIRRLYEEWALLDGRIDRRESFYLDVASLVKLILFWCSGQYLVMEVKSLLMLSGQDVACLLLMLASLVFLALAFYPFVTNTIFIMPLSRLDALSNNNGEDGGAMQTTTNLRAV